MRQKSKNFLFGFYLFVFNISSSKEECQQKLEADIAELDRQKSEYKGCKDYLEKSDKISEDLLLRTYHLFEKKFVTQSCIHETCLQNKIINNQIYEKIEFIRPKILLIKKFLEEIDNKKFYGQLKMKEYLDELLYSLELEEDQLYTELISFFEKKMKDHHLVEELKHDLYLIEEQLKLDMNQIKILFNDNLKNFMISLCLEKIKKIEQKKQILLMNFENLYPTIKFSVLRCIEIHNEDFLDEDNSEDILYKDNIQEICDEYLRYDSQNNILDK